MPTYFQRPENALKRANEFIDVGKKQRALDALYDVIKSKRHRTWQKIHEPIMEKYLHLCVDLKKSHIAKEGLYQYKNICQQVNTKSLEDVVKKYLALAEEKTEVARQESQQTADDVDDLDVLQTPESLLMSAVSGEDMQDRTDRTILTPWLKFLWESYRQCLDLLRNNVSIEKLYHEVSQNAFKFCLKYNRKTEFRKLCEILRTHLTHICKHQNQQRTININNPDSQNLHLETRIVQLDIAIQMELWQEAFKAVEDIHMLIALTKKSPKPALMANYLTKFGLVLYKSDNFMFHACAWHRLYHLYRDQRKTLSESDLQKLASRVLCATLAIPLSGSRSDQLLDFEDNSVEKQKRLMNLLSLPNLPTRHSLVKDLVKYNIVQCVYPELQNLYQWVEVEFNPLKLASRVQSSLDFISKKEELVQYTSALQDVTIMRIVKQVSEVYQTIAFAHLSKLAPFADNFRLEKIIVNAAKSMDLQVRIDHRTGTLTFGSRMGLTQDANSDGPSIQSMPSEQMRHQLINMANAVDKAMNIISPKELKAAREELRLRIMQSYRQTAKKEHQSLLRRRQIIEDRKEELEQKNNQREQKELEQMEELRRKQQEEQTSRLVLEAEERERQRRKEEYKGIQRKVVQERIDQLKKTPLGDRALAQYTEEQLAEMEPDDILAKQIEQLEKEKRELQDKLKVQEKKVDYFERAKHLKERELLEEYVEKERMEMKQFWEQQELERIEQAKKERELALELRDRLERIRPDHDSFLEKLRTERAAVYKEKLVEFERRLADERIKRLDDRRRQRREDRRKRWIMEKEEEEQRKKDEELKRQREEEERLAREKREREEAEYKTKAAKLAEIEDKKRQRELEIEDKLRKKNDANKERRDDEKTHDRDEERVGGWRAQPKEGGWRSREKAKEESWRPGPRNDERPDDDHNESEARWKDSERGPKEERDRYRDDKDRHPDDREHLRSDDRDRDRVRDDRDRDRLREERLRDDRPVEDRDRDRRRDGSPTGKEGRDWRRGGPGDERDSWRRGPPGRDDRPQAGGSGWRDRDRDRVGDRGSRRQDDWRKDERPRVESDRYPTREFDRRDRDGDRFRDSDRQRDRNEDRPRDFDRRDGDRELDRSRDARDRGGPRDRDVGPRDRPGPRDSYDKPRDFDRSFRDSHDRRDADRDNRGNQPSRDWRTDDRAPRTDDRAPPRDDWRGKESKGRQGEPEADRDKGHSSRDAAEDDDGWSVVRH